MPPPPVASVLGSPTSWRVLLDRLASPPRWARSMFAWSLTGAFAASAGNILGYIARVGALTELRMLSSLGVVAAAAIVSLAIILPFMFSGGLYFLFFSRRTALSGALWCASFHVVAHLVIVAWFMGQPWHANLEAPVLIGGLWGLWLPPAINPEGLPNRGWA